MTICYKKLLCCCLVPVFYFVVLTPAHAQGIPKCDRICGKWMSVEKNLAVQVYKEGEDFRAKIIWFNDSDDKSRPMQTRMDTSNPNKALRARKILGMSILDKLVYKPKTNSWERGIIYDAVHGRYWDSWAYITPEGLLKVTGYWHFKFIGKTLSFTRI
ncbi:hypothetical protein BEL04_17450 [Mucilaginibacter sp. PPCGB 2223]|uniref:DUF2147 domain-containing protein n=1 Tax=Mucilaginibacter sp. PPCGB 2223 TaxID=1886027 RepID=UPI0008249A1B|nr:DUF2147 domain-containing protein [Mucilaginibacter sp. PPCGB 2223]OCX51798.1 hypothetical protein BEL04_17450 [Mucilaginibacter sp. PPCGB 2223]